MPVNYNMIEMASRLVPISDFSKGKTAQIFEDIKDQGHEYIVLKNNQPAAVLMSLENFKDIAEKAQKMEYLLEKVEEKKLLKDAIEVAKNYNVEEASDFEELLQELELSEEEIDSLLDEVEIE